MARHIGPHHSTHAIFGLGVIKHRGAALPPRLMHVAGTAGPVGRVFGHERHPTTITKGDLLGRVFGDRVHIGSVEGIGILDIDLLLARFGLALGILDRNACTVQPIAQIAHHRLFLGRAHDRIVDVIAAKGLQIAVALIVERIKRLFKQEKFQLRRHHRGQAQRRGPRDLAFQDRTGRNRHLLVGVMIQLIAHHYRRGRQPRDHTQRAQIRLVDMIAVARLPRR